MPPLPVKETESSSWLYTWAWGIQAAGKNQDAAKKFVAWASSKDYEETVAEELGWQHVPAGKRTSTYENAELPEGRRTLLQADRGRHQFGRSGEPGSPAATDPGRAVRDDPRVRGPRHRHLRRCQLRHRRTHDRWTRHWRKVRRKPKRSATNTRSDRAVTVLTAQPRGGVAPAPRAKAPPDPAPPPPTRPRPEAAIPPPAPRPSHNAKDVRRVSTRRRACIETDHAAEDPAPRTDGSNVRPCSRR
jgi:hypothetical protein